MTKKRRSGQQLEKPQFDFKVTEITHEQADNNDLDNEIQCPSCQNVMTLSMFDSRYYGCDECNFSLYA
jgi:hypothetical protein